MPSVDWNIRGPEIVTCNCNWGCPCQFNALPTNGNCRAGLAMRIEKGHFGKTKLDGLHWAVLAAWPKAIHMGNGEVLPVVDERASPEQREALLKIMTGQETEPFATFFAVFATTFKTVHDPLFKPIEFELNLEKRTGRFRVPGIVDANVEPIRNPVTGNEHRAQVTLPHGFEYHTAEYASSKTRASGKIGLEWNSGHAHLAMLNLTGKGPVH
jgi:hypothetical protein